MATVSIQNLSRPGNTDFYAGERWLIQISGAAAGKTVSCQVVQSGSETSYGTTDADGNFRIIGTMGREDVGIWTEIWKVDGTQVPPTLQFRVRPAPISPSEAPFEIPEGFWLHLAADPPMPEFTFASDDGTVTGASMDITLGSVALDGWASPWNIASTAIGSRLPARRRVYAY